jgi:micrococcal nuclease
METLTMNIRCALSLAPALLLAVPAAAQIVAVDGDTIKLSIRLKGLDTPETDFAKCPEERALGLKAKARLDALMKGKGVRVVPAITKAGHLVTDKYRRGLAVATVNGVDVATILVQEGLARPYTTGRRRSWCAPA